MACHLWVLVFPIVWATLSEKKEQQIQLAKPIIALLSKEYHLKQAQHRPNVVQVSCCWLCVCGSHNWLPAAAVSNHVKYPLQRLLIRMIDNLNSMLICCQALLEGISLSQPQPKIPSELIRFLGKTYSAWHIAIPLLESHVMLFPQVSDVVMLM
jgi:transformation/transcription domain-associated protein